MSEFDRQKPNNDVIAEEGELRRMRDPRTGQIKEVDMSLSALSRTMEQIRKSAEVINQPNTTIETAMHRFDYIKELVLDHAQFSPKLKNLQIKIKNRTIEVVREIEELETARINYARSYFMDKAHAVMAKENRTSREGRRQALEKALEIMKSGEKYFKDDEKAIAYINELQNELEPK